MANDMTLKRAADLKRSDRVINLGPVDSIASFRTVKGVPMLRITFKYGAAPVETPPYKMWFIDNNPPLQGRQRGTNIGGVTID